MATEPVTPTDLALIARYAADEDPAAIAELIRRYRQLVFTTAQRITHNPQDAEDVAQECFFHLMRAAGRVARTVRAPYSLAGWFHLAATREALKSRRFASRRRKYEQQAAASALAQAQSTGAKASRHLDRITAEVDRMLEKLPPDLRMPLIMHYLQDRDADEIARQLGLSRETVISRLRRGVERLRQRLRTEGISASVGAIGTVLTRTSNSTVPMSLRAALGKLALAGVRPGIGLPPWPKLADLVRRVVGVSPWFPVGIGAVLLLTISISTALVVEARRSGSPLAWLSGRRDPYGVIAAAYQPYLSQDDPYAFPAKVEAMTNSRYAFWASSKDLFFRWCSAHTQDWLNDSSSHLLSHGHPLLQSLAGYDAPPLSNSARDQWAGPIDLEESARLPFQLDLLQALVTLQTSAKDDGIELTPAQTQELAQCLLRSYREPPAIGAVPPAARAFLGISASPSQDRSYLDVLARYTVGGRLRRGRITAADGTAELLLPAPPSLAAGFAQNFLELVNYRSTRQDLNRSQPGRPPIVKDIVRWVRCTASPEQGSAAYLVLLDRPILDINHNLLALARQAVPPAIQRAGLAQLLTVDATARALQKNMSALLRPGPRLNWWIHLNQPQSCFEVTVFDPAPDPLTPAGVPDFDRLRQGALALGAMLRQLHQRDPSWPAVIGRCDDSLIRLLTSRAEEFEAELDKDYNVFCADPRVPAMIHQHAASPIPN